MEQEFTFMFKCINSTHFKNYAHKLLYPVIINN